MDTLVIFLKFWFFFESLFWEKELSRIDFNLIRKKLADDDENVPQSRGKMKNKMTKVSTNATLK